MLITYVNKHHATIYPLTVLNRFEPGFKLDWTKWIDIYFKKNKTIIIPDKNLFNWYRWTKKPILRTNIQTILKYCLNNLKINQLIDFWSLRNGRFCHSNTKHKYCHSDNIGFRTNSDNNVKDKLSIQENHIQKQFHSCN